MKLTVIVPAYNESAVIEKTFERLNLILSARDFDYEIILVDDGSTDNTAKLAEDMGLGRLTVVSHGQNLGKGAAVKTGAQKSTGDVVLMMDADSSTDIEEIDRFLAKLNQGCDIVIGSRSLKNSIIVVSQPFWKIAFGRLGNFLIRLITGLKFKDTQCGFKLFNCRATSILTSLENPGWIFDVEILLKARATGMRVCELPIRWKNNFNSKFRLAAYFQFLWQLLKIRNNFKK